LHTLHDFRHITTPDISLISHYFTFLPWPFHFLRCPKSAALQIAASLSQAFSAV